jgi:hypothetical protein
MPTDTPDHPQIPTLPAIDTAEAKVHPGASTFRVTVQGVHIYPCTLALRLSHSSSPGSSIVSASCTNESNTRIGADFSVHAAKQLSSSLKSLRVALVLHPDFPLPDVPLSLEVLSPLSAAALAGIVGGSIAVVILIIAAGIFCCVRRRRSGHPKAAPLDTQVDTINPQRLSINTGGIFTYQSVEAILHQ